MLTFPIIEEDLMVADSADDILGRADTTRAVLTAPKCGARAVIQRTTPQRSGLDHWTLRCIRPGNICHAQAQTHPMNPKLPHGFPAISSRRRRRASERKTIPEAVARL
jgi:hypothetical protein